MASIYKVSFTPQAEADLFQIYADISEVAWPPSAKRWANKILDSAEALALFPEGNPTYEYDTRYHSSRIGKYRIIYEIDDTSKIVSILRIVYARRNLKKIPMKKR